MITAKPIILVGQLYLHDDLNEYLIVTKRKGDEVSYAGPGFRGCIEDEVFIDCFQPVDPVDVDADELASLIAMCPAGTKATTGFIKD